MRGKGRAVPRTQAQSKLAIIGAGNIGLAIAEGLVRDPDWPPQRIILTRRRREALAPYAERGFIIGQDNPQAAAAAELILIAVEPQHIDGVLDELAPTLDRERHVLISVASGVAIAAIADRIGDAAPIVRAMPNTAIAIGESMTCLSSEDDGALERARAVFEAAGKTARLPEEDMASATALGACGIAFFLRAIRAASQGGIEIGFGADEALLIASQTARGAASLLLERGAHPEREIDRVTTPRGCTISGLNRMEHEGFSSAMIQGIIVSARKAGGLYTKE